MGKGLVLKVPDKQNKLSKVSLLVAFAFLIFLLSSLVPAQVIIKEKVEINPQKPLRGENPIITFPDSVYYGSGNKTITKNPQYQSDNLQSTFPLPEGGRITVEILSSEAAENSKLDLQLRQPTQETLIEYANLNEGFTWISPDYFGNTSFEIGIYWYWEYEGTLYEGSESGAEVLFLGSGEYYIGFEAAGDDWDYNELVVRVKIETYLPLVLIDPPNISTGETAVVTVRKQYYDGRIEDFPEGQLFEFGMIEGCAAGVLISGPDTSNYFNGVTQPVIFEAADSLESDEETVKIGVGVVEQNPLAKMQTKTNVLTQTKNRFRDEKNTDAKDDDIKLEDTKINSIIIGTCFGGDFDSDKRSDANVVVVGNECDIYPCNEVILKPNLTYENFQDGTFSTNACIDVIPERGTGVFQTVPKETHKSYDIYFNIENITACYELNFDRWKFGHKLPLFPYFKVIIDTCPNNAIQFGYKPISSISEIKYRYHDSLKLCLAKIDLEGHRNYPPAITYGYVFMQVDYSHEQAHGEDYKNLIDSLQNAFLYPSLDSLQIGCAQVADNTQAKIIYKEELIRILVGQTYNGKIIFSGFENRLSIGKENHSKGSYLINGKILSYEEYINKFPIVENTINVLMADFKNIWNCK